MTRVVSSVVLLCAAAVVIVLTLSALVPIGGIGANAGPVASVPGPAAPASLLAEAAGSLAHGPSAPSPCSVVSSTSARCGAALPSGLVGRDDSPAVRHAAGAVISSVHPSVAALPQWYNQTATLALQSEFEYGNALPEVLQGGSMAYDPILQEVVLWVGCGVVCPSAETWVYTSFGWDNITGSLLSAPSARDWSGMDFDPVLGAVVLVGGFNVSGNATADTWTFNGAWTNITATVGLTPHQVGYGSLAWDPALGGLAYVDGCSSPSCTVMWSITDVLNGTCVTIGFGPGFTSLSYLGIGSMVWDPTDGYLVWFGGYDYYSATSVNYTYTFTPTGGWVNITSSDGTCVTTCGATPPARYETAVTWDGQLGAVLLIGGVNLSSGLIYNDSWEFLHGVWFPEDAAGGAPPAAFLPIFGAGLPENSSLIAPFVVGGVCGYSYDCAASEWVVEDALSPYVASVAPDPVDVNVSVAISGTYLTTSGSGPVSTWEYFYGNGNVSTTTVSMILGVPFWVNTSQTYATAGNYSVQVYEFDYFYVLGASALYPLTVNPPLAASFSESPTSGDAGTSVSFSGAATNGTSPYTFSWNFGDGSPVQHGVSPTHVYAAAGTFTVHLTVTDNGGGSVTVSHTVSMNAALGANVAFTPTAPVAGHAVNFTVTASGGSGTYTFAWLFGVGTAAGTGAAPTYTYAAAGTYTVTVWINDSVGGSLTKTLAVTVSAAPSGTGSSSSPLSGTTTLLIIVVVIVVVVGLAAALLMRRRKGGSSAAPAPPPPGAGTPPPGAMGPSPPSN